MGNSYKGIVVQIGADMSPMLKELKNSEKESRSLQNELKQVERLLKLDPKNTELVSQKQQILAQSVKETAARLDVLRQAQEKVNKAHAENGKWEQKYAPLQAAIQQTTQKMNALAAEEKELQKEMSSGAVPAEKYNAVKKALEETIEKSKELKQAQRELEKQFSDGHISDSQYREFQRTVGKTELNLKSLEGQSKDAKKALEDSAKGSETFGGKLVELGEHATNTESAIGSKLTKTVNDFAVASVAAGAASVAAFIDFQDEFIKVQTLIDDSVLSMESARNGILNLSNGTGLAAKNVASAEYDALSAGIKTANIQQFMAQATQTAVAGFTDASTSVDILTTILNSYEMQVQDVTSVSDKLLVAQDKGKVTVGEFSNGLGNLVGIAAQAGVSLDDVLSAIASLTASGLKPSSAINSLKSAISNMIKPTAEAEKEAKKLHLSFNAQSLAAGGLSGMLEQVKTRTGGNTEKMAQLFGSVEGLNAMMILCGKDGNAKFKESLEGMNDSLGTTSEKFETISSDPAFKFKQSITEMGNALIGVGIALTPLINALAWLFSVIAKIPPGILIAIGTFITLAALIIKLADSFTSLSKIGGKVGGFFGGINTGMMKTVGIVLIVVAALAALLAIIAVLCGKKDDLTQTFSSMGESVQQVKGDVYGAGKPPPHYATGTGYHMGGRAYVGEYGPEIMELPQGAKIHTAARSRQLAGDSPAQTTNYYVSIPAKDVKEFNDIVRIAKSQRQTLRAK